MSRAVNGAAEVGYVLDQQRRARTAVGPRPLGRVISGGRRGQPPPAQPVRNRRELDVEPIEAEAVDPYTRCRIITGIEVEASSAAWSASSTPYDPFRAGALNVSTAWSSSWHGAAILDDGGRLVPDHGGPLRFAECVGRVAAARATAATDGVSPPSGWGPSS